MAKILEIVFQTMPPVYNANPKQNDENIIAELELIDDCSEQSFHVNTSE